MEEQRQRAGGQRKRRRNNKNKGDAKSKPAPVLIAARRPDSPLLSKLSSRSIAASAQPKKPKSSAVAVDSPEPKSSPTGQDKPRRVARMAQAQVATLDDDQLRRERLLDRLVGCEGRSAISRIANEFWNNDIAIPEEQEVQLQLLEHMDERRARDAIDAMSRLLKAEAPIKKPILDQRLRRLEDEAEDAETREKAAELRRMLRGAA